MKSCLYEGWVRHRRLEPVPHAFRYRLFMLYLDLDELDEVFRGRWLWSARRPALAWFRRRDHLGNPAEPLRISIERLVESTVGRRPTGPIRLLTHLRYFGYCMNPVSFYYCHDADDEHVETIVAEVHNTPWGERHAYVLGEETNEGRPGRHRHRFEKAFHVSPFMGMNQHYDWQFTAPSSRLTVHMDNIEDGRRVLDATMALRRRPIDGRGLASCLARHPFMTAKVVSAIYWQAWRLHRKRVPFHPHPRHRSSTETGS